MIENWVQEFTLAISLAVEAIAALLVAYAVGEAVFHLIGRLYRRGTAREGREAIRLQLGQWLALALELLLGADILRTAVAPSWAEIGKLAAIATIRTALNYFLQREIEAERRRSPSPSNSSMPE
ncbi:DUF1622 domain-containing protein [Altericroceibacterium endophyticum]|uniref:DUF1622 domain-containing protein n=1 Tax=Altericroceibacterium endophyticum TaxID=1808508 RepID=A0A6I4T5T2_9SPHN|nr:DUF1622 domain-containing protein [Altericroceibacterium endophyticum]MXO66564.1 DUF1622 domain-containing protein [Altericroceibacterium endophyticum]